ETAEAMFFAYLVPEPAECAAFPMDVPSTAWAAEMKEWVLPYAAVRARPDHIDVIRRFMDAAYRAAGDLAGWDLSAFTYAPPSPAPGPAREARASADGTK